MRVQNHTDIVKDGTLSETNRDEVISELKRDLDFILFSLMPNAIEGETWLYYAHRLGIDEEEAARYRMMLLEAGLWRETQNGIQADSLIDAGEFSVSEFLTYGMHLNTRLSESGPCKYEAIVVPTSLQAKRHFYKQIDKAVRELVESSVHESKECIIATSFTSVECLRLISES